jgi:hypothetical protein
MLQAEVRPEIRLMDEGAAKLSWSPSRRSAAKATPARVEWREFR